MARPKSEWHATVIRFRPGVMAIINAYRATREGLSQSDAIHQLIERGAEIKTIGDLTPEEREALYDNDCRPRDHATMEAKGD